jgi:hypothetical protein
MRTPCGVFAQELAPDLGDQRDRHWTDTEPLPREHNPCYGARRQRTQDRDGLAGERDDVPFAGFHPRGGNAPLGLFQIDLQPPRLTQLAGAHQD